MSGCTMLHTGNLGGVSLLLLRRYRSSIDPYGKCSEARFVAPLPMVRELFTEVNRGRCAVSTKLKILEARPFTKKQQNGSPCE